MRYTTAILVAALTALGWLVAKAFAAPVVILMPLVLAWDAYPESVDGYELDAGTRTWSTGNVTTLSIQDMPEGAHTFRIRARQGQSFSPWSAPVDARSFRVTVESSPELLQWREQLTVQQWASPPMDFWRAQIR